MRGSGRRSVGGCGGRVMVTDIVGRKIGIHIGLCCTDYRSI